MHLYDQDFRNRRTQSAAHGPDSELAPCKPVYPPDNRPSSVAQLRLAKAMANGNPVQRAKNNTGLPDHLKSGIENLSGHSMDDVKVHYNSDKPAQLNAHAYAQGSDIHLAQGQEKHLPHEAWHVVQQKQGRVQPTMQMRGKVNVNDDRGLEKEADVMGMRAMHTSISLPGKNQYTTQKSNDTVKQFAEWKTFDGISVWDELIDGVEWFSDGEGMMWFLIKKPEQVLKGKLEDYLELEKEKKTWHDWNTISVEPHPIPHSPTIGETGAGGVSNNKISDDRRLDLAEHNDLIAAKDLPLIIAEKLGVDIVLVKMALIDHTAPVGKDSKEFNAVKLQVANAIKLLNRICSVLKLGILRPTDLKKKQVNYTPSSDTGEQEKISMFDVDLERNAEGDREERFPYPGHQSIGPVLERQDDFKYLVGNVYKAALEGKKLAIEQFEEFRSILPAFFPEIKEVSKDNIKQMFQIMGEKHFQFRPLTSLFMGWLVKQPHIKPVLEGRARRSAMFISTGDKLASNPLSKEQATKGPKVQELRIGLSMQPEFISHVLLPDYMNGFAKYLLELFPNVSLILVRNVDNIQVGYYNESTRASSEVHITVPNYQAAIDQLTSKGHRKMLTHISNID